MKRLILAILISFNLSAQPIPQDKMLHFSGCYIASATTTTIARTATLTTRQTSLKSSAKGSQSLSRTPYPRTEAASDNIFIVGL